MQNVQSRGSPGLELRTTGLHHTLLLKIKTSSACASGKQKEPDKSHFSSCSFYVLKKVEAAKVEDIGA